MTLREHMSSWRAQALNSIGTLRRRLSRQRRGGYVSGFDIKRWLAMDLKELGPQLKAFWRQARSTSVRRGFRMEDVAHWPRPFRVGVLLLSFVLAFCGAALLVWPEPAEQLALQRQETAALKLRYVQVRAQSQLKPVLEEQILELESQFGSMLEKIPASLETVQVLQQMTRAARDSGLRLHGFKPLPEVQEDAYAVLPVDIRLVGSYHAVGRFLEAVSHMKHLITVDVLMEADSANPGDLVLATRLKAYRADDARLAPVGSQTTGATHETR